MPKTVTVTDRIINRAKEYVGFRSRAQKVNGFGAASGMNGTYWDGSFIETVLREEKLTAGSSLVSTTAALAAFVRENRLYQKPRPGDIAFFAWSTDDNGLGQPHVGIVTEVKDWKKLGKIRTVEGQASSGLPRGPKEPDGVYERTRYAPEVIGFARPKYRTVTSAPNREEGEEGAVLRPSTVPQKITEEYGNSTVLLQLALHKVTGVSGLNRGVYDQHTRAAMSDFQRRIGYTDGATGFADYRTLSALAAQTSGEYFTAAV